MYMDYSFPQNKDCNVTLLHTSHFYWLVFAISLRCSSVMNLEHLWALIVMFQFWF